MKVSMILDQARSGELNQLSDKSKTDKVVISYINLALIALNNRFQFETEEAIVNVQAAKSIYKLDGTDTDVSMGSGDTGILNLMYAYEEDGRAIKINDTYDPYSVLLISHNKVQIPVSGEDPTSISLIYTREATLVDESNFTFDAEGMITNFDVDGLGERNIDIPLAVLEPMLFYIGYRAIGAMDANIQSESNTHLMRFKASCDDLEKMGIIMANKDSGYIPIQDKGWV